MSTNSHPAISCIQLSPEKSQRLRLHLSQMWPELTRDLKHAVAAAADLKTNDNTPSTPIYVSAHEDIMEISARLEKILTPQELVRIAVMRLPGLPEDIIEPGLLYLPGRYVVPGGRFNELYGWDGYFISLGLLRDGRTGLAQSMADQFLYEVKHYGAVLNCNRSYCLNRSHPPFLSQLVRRVFEHTGDLAWLREAMPALESYHAFWTTTPHLLPGTGLSRYHAMGTGPAPEVVEGEVDAHGLNHYQRLCNTLRDHPQPEPWFASIYDAATHSLTSDGYKNDRTVRESGFDITNRFGLCGLASRDYLPVCLNTLLWAMETDLAHFGTVLDCHPEITQRWENAALQRATAMHQYFWDERAGLFQDWNLRTNQRSNYAFATTFMPLWAGWATPEQAARVCARLPDFLAPGGLLTSLQTTGCQWDAPFTWAPLVYMASTGLAHYGHSHEASEISCRFVNLVASEFARTGQLFEKYDAIACSADVEGKIAYGYPSNETGFGWTNGVLAEFLGSFPAVQ